MLTANKERVTSLSNLNQYSPDQCLFTSTEDVPFSLILNCTKYSKKSRDAHHIVQLFSSLTLAFAIPSASDMRHFEYMQQKTAF